MFTRIAVALIFFSQIGFANAGNQEVATAADVAAVKSKLESYLVDPGSVQYRKVVAKSEGKTTYVCLEYNAKNRMGGYVGFTNEFCQVEGKDIKCERADFESALNADLKQLKTQRAKDNHRAFREQLLEMSMLGISGICENN